MAMNPSYRAGNVVPIPVADTRAASPKRRTTARERAATAAQRADNLIAEQREDYGAYTSTSLLGLHAMQQFEVARRHRDNSGMSLRLIHCLRAFNGEYSPTQLAQITEFGGSDAYLRITAVKCRTLSALLSELYLSTERPWTLSATPVPTLPDSLAADIETLVSAENEALAKTGAARDPEAIAARRQTLIDEAIIGAKNIATKDAARATDALDDELVEGGFYRALEEFVLSFSIFPVAVLKGPFYKSARRIKYGEDKRARVVTRPVLAFSCPSPFDLWFSPGVSEAGDGDIFERVRLSKADLQALARLPSYDGKAISAFIAANPDGYSPVFDSTVESARRDEENRDTQMENDSNLYAVLEFHGFVDHQTIVSEPLISPDVVEAALALTADPDEIEAAEAAEDSGIDDSQLALHVTVRMLGSVVISAHLNPDPLERPIYQTAAYEAVPGSVYGRGLPEAIEDSQNLGNAAMRAVVNNMGLASGPMVGVNTGVMAETQNTTKLHPWKQFHFVSDPAAPTAPPLLFFQPSDNSGALLNVIERAMQHADETSAIPRYAAGSERAGGAARTASGLAQLQGNVARLVKFTAKAIDNRVLAPILSYLYDMKMLSDETGMFRGDETIRPLGVQAAQKAESERMRALEFLSITANPIDAQILGPQGRALVLKEVADNLGFDNKQLSSQIEKNLRAMEAAAQQAAANPAAQAAPGAAPGAPSAPGAAPTPPGQAEPGAPRPMPAADAAMNRPAAGIEGMTRVRGPGELNA
jgi:hypothetical protein